MDFVKVLDEIVLGDDEDDPGGQTVDRAYWETKSTKKMLKVVDDCFDILKEIKPDIKPKYNKYYIGVTIDGSVQNFVLFKAKKAFVRVEAVLPDQESWRIRLDEAGLIVMVGEKKRKRLVIQLLPNALKQHKELVKEFLTVSYQEQVQG